MWQNKADLLALELVKQWTYKVGWWQLKILSYLVRVFDDEFGDEVGCAETFQKCYYFFKRLYLKSRKIGSFITILLQKSSQKNRGTIFHKFHTNFEVERQIDFIVRVHFTWAWNFEAYFLIKARNKFPFWNGVLFKERQSLLHGNL